MGPVATPAREAIGAELCAIENARGWDARADYNIQHYHPGKATPRIRPARIYFALSNFSNSDSVRMGTPSSLALSYLEPGSVPTTT